MSNGCQNSEIRSKNRDWPELRVFLDFLHFSGGNPAGHRWWWTWLCSAGCGLPTSGLSLAGNGLRREDRRERWWKVERESLIFGERGRNPKMTKCLGFLGYIKRLPGQMWKFHDTRSIHKTRMNHLEFLVKFLSFVLPLNCQLKVSAS